jgi:mannose-6-phosphate isomerase-like protein (cupin superfamily)
MKKPWGAEKILVQNPYYVIKRLEIKAGHRLSLQYHKKKIETIFVQEGVAGYASGPCRVVLSRSGRKIKILWPGEWLHIPAGQVHRFEATGASDVVLIECSSPQLDDLVRIEDDYNRK